MRETAEPDLWITNELDPWIMVAAHAGDVRAMRCAAHRVSYRPSRAYERLATRARLRLEDSGFGLPSPLAVSSCAREATERERRFWYTTAAEHGDAECIAELVDQTVIAQQREDEQRLTALANRLWAADDELAELSAQDLRRRLTPDEEARYEELAAEPRSWESVANEASELSAQLYGPHRLGEDHQEEHLWRLLAAPGNQRDVPDAGPTLLAVQALIRGDGAAAADAIDQLPPDEHRLRRLLGSLVTARFRPPEARAGDGSGLAGWWSIDLCRTGAQHGNPACARRWADYQQHYGADHEVEARRRQQTIEAELDEVLPPPPPPRFGGGPNTLATVVITAVITSGVVPFVQAMIAKAAEESYNGLRRLLKTRFGKVAHERDEPDRDDQLLVVRPPEDEPPGAVLQVWTDLPDEAIVALSQLLHDLRTIQTPGDAETRWYWNASTRRWEVLKLR
jgi:hypothetical protein